MLEKEEGFGYEANSGQMLEKEEGFGVKIFSEGLILSWVLPQSTQIANISYLVLNAFGTIFVNSTDIHISLLHTVHNREIWGICERAFPNENCTLSVTVTLRWVELWHKNCSFVSDVLACCTAFQEVLWIYMHIVWVCGGDLYSVTVMLNVRFSFGDAR